MENRRNYYRVLNVQPDAPEQIIKASYRTLMQSLKMHPDLGGDHWNASLVNEAYGVLSNPDKRSEYDETLKQRLMQQREQHCEQVETPQPSLAVACVFCKTPSLHPDHQQTCSECQSPLSPLQIDPTADPQRRNTSRYQLAGDIRFYTYWPQSPETATVINVSPTGLSIKAPARFFRGQILKLASPLLQATAEVMHTECIDTQRRISLVGLGFKTIAFEEPKGLFVQVRC